jgi:nucleoside-diphosphate-sugar epimerase
MRVLVTGAAGFLGREYVRYHLRRGDEVIGVDDLSNPYSYWPDELTRRSEQDAAAYFVASDGLVRFDLAYHLAAPVGGRVKIEGDPLFNADSLRLDSLFFRWAVRNVVTAVYPSSSAVYGVSFQGKKGQALHEGMFHPDNPNWFKPDEMYGFTKMAGEVLACKAAGYGLNVLCLRPFSGYGEEQSLEYPVPSIALRAVRMENPIVVWGTGEQKRDFVHVSDLVAATAAYLDHFGKGITGYHAVNVGSGHAVSFNQIARICAEIVAQHPQADIVARAYNPVIENLMDKPQGVENRWADTGRLARYHRPVVGLRDGLSMVIEHLKETHAGVE